MTKYRQGIFKPKNTSKYKGDPTNIVYRSSWERIVFSYLDQHSNCIGWSSEETIIPYRSPVDGKIHRYFVDIKATFKTNNTAKTFLIEIKPFAQTQPPTSKNKRVLLEATATYAVNQAKWDAARKLCKESGYEFMILTEYEIGLKKR
jgi:hypothetical protein